MKNTTNLLLFVIILISGFGCKNNNSNKSEADALNKVDVEEAKELIATIPAPNSLIVMNLLNESGAGYIFDITNNPEYVNNYLTKRQQAIALGVFSSDLSYVAIYHQKEEATAYIKTFQKLIDVLQITAVNPKYMDRVQANLDNKDSLIFLVNQVFSNANNYLNNSDQLDVALYVLSGSWIETVYLIEKTIQFSANKSNLIKLILKNKQTLDKTVELLENKKNTVEFIDLYETLHNIQKLINEVSEDTENEAKIEELRSAIIEARENII